MKKKLVLSLVVLVVVVAMVVGATTAYFSDSGTSSQNTFTSGTVDLMMANGGTTNWGDNTVATWVSPSNWAPGEVFTGTLDFTNVGTIDLKCIYFDFTAAPNSILLDKIYVTGWYETFNGVQGGNQVAALEGYMADGDGILTLRELIDSVKPIYTDYNTDNAANPLLAAGNKKDYSLSYTFKFAEDAGNNYQGKTAGLNLTFTATQNNHGE